MEVAVESQQPQPLPANSSSPPPSDQTQDAIMPPTPPAAAFQPPQENTESESSAPDRPATTSSQDGQLAELNNDVMPVNNQTQEVNDPDAMDTTPINPGEQLPDVPVPVPVSAEGQDQTNEHQDTMETDPPANGVNGVDTTTNAEDQPQESAVENTNTSEIDTTTNNVEENQPPVQETDAPEVPTTSQDTTENASAESSERSQLDDEDDSQDKQDEDENEEPAYWADIEEDTSVPDEEEMKEIESNTKDDSAVDYEHWENSFFTELEDPEYKPAQKARITWTIKGVRGTKEKPNRATIIRSPPAFIGGYYWTLKFFPRGNNISSLSVYLECSPAPPTEDEYLLDAEFKVVTGLPDAKLSDLTPDVDIKLPAPVVSSKRNSVSEPSEAEPKETPASEDTGDAAAEIAANQKAARNTAWRAPAQIGVVLYNPDEPRTRQSQTSAHQFSSHNPDWGWTNFHGPWDQIHRRQHGQRQALLRNDTLSFDAYIRIFDDSTKSLWWHYSDSEPIWDSLALIGYPPMGDPKTRFSHEVAGLASWILLKPFRDILQSVDYQACLRDPNVRPKPLCNVLVDFLLTMESQGSKAANESIDMDRILSRLRVLDESSSDVISFWEIVRRTLDLELAGTDAAGRLSKLFDSQPSGSLNTIPNDYNSRIRVIAETTDSVQSGVTKYLESTPGKWSLPSVMHVDLARQKFDYNAREWKLMFNRVQLDEELDLSEFVDENETGKYSLYGFIVHKGNRASGMYHCVLRPGGPDTHWLAFRDEDSKRIECLTKKAALAGHEGLTAEELKESSNSDSPDVAVAVMYVRNDLVPEYLTGSKGPWASEPPKHHFRPNLSDCEPDESPRMVKVEAYRLDQNFPAFCTTTLDEHDLMAASTAAGNTLSLEVPETTTLQELRRKLANLASFDDDMIPNIRLWQMKSSVSFSTYMAVFDDLDRDLKYYNMKIVRLWVHVLDDGASKCFALYDPSPKVEEKPETEENAQAEEVQENPSQQDDEPADAPLDQNGDTEMNDATVEESDDPPQTVPTPRATTPQPESETRQESTETQEASTPPPEQAQMQTEPADQIQPNGVETEQPTTNGDISVADEAAIAEMIARDLEEIDAAEAMDISENNNDNLASTGDAEDASNQNLESVSTPPVAQLDTSVGQNQDEDQDMDDPIPSVNEDSQMAGSPIQEPVGVVENASDENAAVQEQVQEPVDAVENASNENAAVQEQVQEPEPAPEPQPQSEHEAALAAEQKRNEHLIPSGSQVYFFLQEFDADKQELRVCGAFFARRSEYAKDKIRSLLGWDSDKSFELYHRQEGCVMSSVSKSQKFKAVIRHRFGERFIVADAISHSRRDELAKAGLFSKPSQLLSYLWAKERKHPIKSFTGKKTIEASLNGEYYDGEFLKGHFHGTGTHISDAAAIYKGDYIQGQKHGAGTLQHASGDSYEGEWASDQPDGQGTFIHHKTGNKYVGGYRHGKRYGKGVSYWEVADEEMNLCQICYSEEQDALFYSCGHICACLACARQVENCPICREVVGSVVKFYRC